MKVLITGSSGYIGKCLFHYLNSKKIKVIGVDKYVPIQTKNNLKLNLLNKKKIDKLLKEIKPDIVIHLAAQSLVDEKITKKRYIDNNNKATINLLESMNKNNIRNIIFSSTAAVYRSKNKPIFEYDKLKPLSNYAKSKLDCEKIIKKNKYIKYVILRFFNVCSALKLKKIYGEFHNPETHLIPTVIYKCVARQKVFIYGNNFNTYDKTCVRNFIHIFDICESIFKSIKYIVSKKRSSIFNIGSKINYSVNEIIRECEKFLNQKIKLKIMSKRTGDTDFLSCNINKAKKYLNWSPKKSYIKKIIKDEKEWIDNFTNKGLRRRFKYYT
tara:strand:- start:920 stop:1897 length:978 start_codon:yes stop_codon:yes gene_type:complete